jgi:hypothetical protein
VADVRGQIEALLEPGIAETRSASAAQNGRR